MAKKKSQGRSADVICAWCKKKMGKTRTPSGKPSHSICKRCMKIYFPPAARNLRPNPNLHSVMRARKDAIDEAMEFQSNFEDKGNNMSDWARRDLLKDAMDAAGKMVNARKYVNLNQFSMAETIYESVRTILSRLGERMDGGY